ncbi:MAG UNVERIFIED_CONTAM: hypothetical protein LVR18_15105 [Planctomycetaceae bacterium]|jgi:hypothetical protein
MARRGTPEEIARAQMTLEKFIQFCADQKLSATELTGYYFPKTVTSAYLLGLRSLLHRQGLSVSATAIGNDFCLPQGTLVIASLPNAASGSITPQSSGSRHPDLRRQRASRRLRRCCH